MHIQINVLANVDHIQNGVDVGDVDLLLRVIHDQYWICSNGAAVPSKQNITF